MTAGQQDDFVAALLDPGATVPPGLSDGRGRPAGRRFDVYRNNVAVSLTEALRDGFPVVTRLIGPENMDGLAGLFLRAHPPDTPLMMHYGAALPEFIATLPQVSDIGYLPDIARLELALRRAYHAADADPADPGALAALPPEALMRARITLAPATGIIRSVWPIHAIWRFNTEPGAPKPVPGAEDVLVTRPEFDPVPHLLPPGGAAFIQGLAEARTLGEAHGAAAEEAPGFDPAPSLSLLLQGRAITNFTAED